MKTLCINTAAEPYFFALYDDERVCIEESFLADYFNLENLGEHLVRRLQELNLLSIDQIAVVRGPGKYTALRLGLTVAKALGSCWQVPVIGLDSLALLARSSGAMDRIILTLFHLRAKQVYVALNKYTENSFELLSEPFVSDETGVVNLSKKLDSAVLFVSQKSLGFSAQVCRTIFVRPLNSLAMIQALKTNLSDQNGLKKPVCFPQARYVFEP